MGRQLTLGELLDMVKGGIDQYGYDCPVKFIYQPRYAMMVDIASEPVYDEDIFFLVQSGENDYAPDTAVEKMRNNDPYNGY